MNQCDSFGRTPLHVACAADYSDMVKFLLHNGADITIRTKGEDQTAIHYAAKNDAVNALKILMENGASLNDLDYKGRTPLQVSDHYSLCR